MEIRKVVVIGSGTMGSGIAAHLCNADIPVTLLDLTTEISEKARERIHKSRPPLLIDKSKINNIHVGNINENFDVIKDADWVVEAVVERIDIKHNIYEKIFKNRKKGAIVSSNTSSIPIKVLSEKLTDEEKRDFCITHFFNPVRYMGLLEIVKNENNDLEKINSLKKFCEVELGKGAIVCNDTPGFLGGHPLGKSFDQNLETCFVIVRLMEAPGDCYHLQYHPCHSVESPLRLWVSIEEVVRLLNLPVLPNNAGASEGIAIPSARHFVSNERRRRAIPVGKLCHAHVSRSEPWRDSVYPVASRFSSQSTKQLHDIDGSVEVNMGSEEVSKRISGDLLEYLLIIRASGILSGLNGLGKILTLIPGT